ncbi:MAG: MurR/RpiR family transcriptional regulator [Eubacteriales bacterium]|jgi:DNA-binding MurR/RpiR family transcriptional regulator|nr:MurR/RpiR family transcriptional regulator [Clostridiales bacterium]
MNTNILNEIKSRMPEMSKGQRRIAEYILNHYDRAAFMTAAKLGRQAGVSESTVVRFAIELGFDGYPELMRAVKDTVRSKLTSVQRIEVTNERLGDSSPLEKTLLSDIANIRATIEENNPDDFAAAIDEIIEAKNIYIAGVRLSSFIAQMLAYNLSLVFDNVKCVNTESEDSIYEQMLRIGEGDILIAITFPRYSRRIIKAVSFASAQGAKVIGVTDGVSSPIASRSDRLLFAKSDMASYMDSLVAPLSLINAIIVAIGRKKQDELSDTLLKLERIWDEYHLYEKDTDND